MNFCAWAFRIGVAGFLFNLAAAFLLLLLSPSRSRYQKPGDDVYAQDRGLRRWAGDQGKIAALVVLGVALQLASLILSNYC
jgi:hypothetical protein